MEYPPQMERISRQRIICRVEYPKFFKIKIPLENNVSYRSFFRVVRYTKISADDSLEHGEKQGF